MKSLVDAYSLRRGRETREQAFVMRAAMSDVDLTKVFPEPARAAPAGSQKQVERWWSFDGESA